jgi:long-subunit acyl-CoA synthetase (AMP-forming)
MYSKFENAGKNLTGLKKLNINGPCALLTTMIIQTVVSYINLFSGFLISSFTVNGEMLSEDMKCGLLQAGQPLIQILRLFTAAKLHIYQGYGMTETSPVISVNSPANNVLGTNGEPIDDAELKFAEDGEILVRGAHVMKGYYKDEKATREIIDSEGWLHTGDIGYLQDGKYLMITDRKKEIFKLSSGKYIAPQVIENKLRGSSFISNCIVFGENESFASAIILPIWNKFAIGVKRIISTQKLKTLTFLKIEKSQNYLIKKFQQLIKAFLIMKELRNASFQQIPGLLKMDFFLRPLNTKGRIFLPNINHYKRGL